MVLILPETPLFVIACCFHLRIFLDIGKYVSIFYKIIVEQIINKHYYEDKRV